MAKIPDEVADERMADLLDLLRDRLTAEKPMTEAEALEFCRNAYLRGYDDRLTGDAA